MRPLQAPLNLHAVMLCSLEGALSVLLLPVGTRPLFCVSLHHPPLLCPIRCTVTWRHGRFNNPWDTWEERSFSDVLKWNRERRKCALVCRCSLAAEPAVLCSGKAHVWTGL